jgi:hypothetical protein
VKVKRHRLVGLVLRELLEHRGDLRVALSRPCVYGVFSGQLGVRPGQPLTPAESYRKIRPSGHEVLQPEEAWVKREA